jgi:hypothetical protein
VTLYVRVRSILGPLAGLATRITCPI